MIWLIRFWRVIMKKNPTSTRAIGIPNTGLGSTVPGAPSAEADQ